MLEDIYKIGKTVISRGISSDIEQDIMPETPNDIQGVISLMLNEKDGEFTYSGINFAEYNRNNATQYLLRKKSPNGSNFGPTAQIAGSIQRTLENKVFGWFKSIVNIGRKFGLNKEELLLINKMYTQLNEKVLCIQEDIEKLSIENGKNILTVTVNSKYPKGIPVLFKSYTLFVKHSIFGEGLIGSVCYLCGRKEIPLVPALKVFKFYTKDKPGFISGGFNEENFWRNCPVCIECEPILRVGKKYLLENLRFQFCGFTYYLFPGFIDEGEDLLGEFQVTTEFKSKKDFSFSQEYESDYLGWEGEILYSLTEKPDIYSFHLFFLEQQQGGNVERILLHIKDIYPSRFRILYAAKDIVNKVYEKRCTKFNFFFFREFLSKTDKKTRINDLDAIFLEIVNSVFIGGKVDLKTLLPHYMRNVRHEFVEGRGFEDLVLKGYAGVRYLYEVGCLPDRKEIYMESRFEPFFKKYSLGLGDSALKCALLLTGAFVQKVMNVQGKELKTTKIPPFVQRLKGLKLRPHEVEGLINDGISKLMEYNSYSNASKRVVAEIFRLMLKTPTQWDVGVDEINFHIAGGMALWSEIYDLAEDKKENEGEAEETI